MSTFVAKQVSKHRTQLNTAAPSKVFPLLCPVREKDWIDGWEYTMIYSRSGVAEEGCVFSTPAPGGLSIIWYVTVHDTITHRVEFVRVTAGEMLVRIIIKLSDNGNNTTNTDITYQYTSLSEEANEWISNKLDDAFRQSMDYWEAAINHYLVSGDLLKK